MAGEGLRAVSVGTCFRDKGVLDQAVGTLDAMGLLHRKKAGSERMLLTKPVAFLHTESRVRSIRVVVANDGAASHWIHSNSRV